MKDIDLQLAIDRAVYGQSFGKKIVNTKGEEVRRRINPVEISIHQITDSIKNLSFIFRCKSERFWRIGRKVKKHPFIDLINRD